MSNFPDKDEEKINEKKNISSNKPDANGFIDKSESKLQSAKTNKTSNKQKSSKKHETTKIEVDLISKIASEIDKKQETTKSRRKSSLTNLKDLKLGLQKTKVIQENGNSEEKTNLPKKQKTNLSSSKKVRFTTENNGKNNCIDKKLKPGYTIGGCEILDFIGKGGMGSVYKAKQISLEKIVAVKILSEKFHQNEEFVNNFVTEARVAAKIEHRNVVQVFDTGIQDNIPYILMQYISGQNLRDISRKKRLSTDRLLNYFIQAASGLAAAHKKKVIHRDIKPENLVLMNDDLLKIADFGLARLEEELIDDKPIDGKIMASASFMAPEQADLNPIDSRSDLYSLGVTFYLLLTGKKPFIGENHFELVLKHHLEQPTCATLINREISLSLAAVLDKLMRKDPSQRYQSVKALLSDLEKIKKYNHLNIEQPWSFETFSVSTIDTELIDKKGFKICIKKQKEKLNKKENPDLLGQLMLKGNFVKMSKPTVTDIVIPENLSFVIKKENTGKTKKLSLIEFENQLDDNKNAEFRVIYTPITANWDNFHLNLTLRTSFKNCIEVQHFFDFVENFPYPLAFEVNIKIENVELSLLDIHWLVDSYNMISKKKGDFKIIVTSKINQTFLNTHKLDKFITIQNILPQKPDSIQNFEFDGLIDNLVDELIASDGELKSNDIKDTSLDKPNRNLDAASKKTKKQAKFSSEPENSTTAKKDAQKNQPSSKSDFDIDKIMNEIDQMDSGSVKKIDKTQTMTMNNEVIRAKSTAETEFIVKDIDSDEDSKTDAESKIDSDSSTGVSKIKKVESTYITKTPFLYQPNEENNQENMEANLIRDLFNKGDFENAYQEVLSFILSGEAQSEEFKAITSEIAVKLFSEGEYLIKQKYYKEAQEKFEKVIEIKKNEFGAYFYKSICLKKKRKLSSALEFINVAIKLENNNPELYYNRAILFYRMKQLQNSIDDLTKAIQLDPKHFNAYYNRGLAYEKIKKFSEALDDYKTALSLNPDFRKILTPRLAKIAKALENDKNN